MRGTNFISSGGAFCVCRAPLAVGIVLRGGRAVLFTALAIPLGTESREARPERRGDGSTLYDDVGGPSGLGLRRAGVAGFSNADPDSRIVVSLSLW